MPIVHQSALFLPISPPVYLLPAPPKRLALPQPKIAGLLAAPIKTEHDHRLVRSKTSPASVPEMADTLENLVLNCPNFDDLLEAIGPIRTAAELEAEFAAIQARIEARFQQLYDYLSARAAHTGHHSARYSRYGNGQTKTGRTRNG